MAAKDAMFSQLMGKLKEELGKGDPASAIAVCQVEAPRNRANIRRIQPVFQRPASAAAMQRSRFAEMPMVRPVWTFRQFH